MKNKFPFRLGTTSYIIPDDIIPNVKYLADKVDDIEIVLFESDEFSNLPNQKVIDELIELKDKNDLSYTIHLPLDIALGSTNEEVRKNSIAKCLRVICLMKQVNPFAYVLHLIGQSNNMGIPSKEESISDWLPGIDKSLEELKNAGVNLTEICIENLRYPFEDLENVLEKHGISICLDIGHILLNEYSLEQYLRKYFSRTKVIHIHGIIDGVDHKDLSNFDKEKLEYFIKYIIKNKTNDIVFTIEIFSENDFKKSIKVMEGFTNL